MWDHALLTPETLWGLFTRGNASAEPELWHFEAICWRRRSRLGPWFARAAAGAADRRLRARDFDRLPAGERSAVPRSRSGALSPQEVQ